MYDAVSNSTRHVGRSSRKCMPLLYSSRVATVYKPERTAPSFLVPHHYGINARMVICLDDALPIT